MSEPFAQRYLRHPDLFPRRLSGEPCGEGCVSIDFVGGPFVVAGLAGWQEDVIRRQWGNLCRAAQHDEDPTVHVFRAAARDFVEGDPAGEPMGLEFDYQQERISLAGQNLMGIVENPEDAAAPHRAALFTAAEATEDFVGVFENFFRVVLAYRLLELGGVLLHSAGVVDRGSAFVFVGQSGAGKSTLSRLSLEGGRHVLSDDLNALLPAAADHGRLKQHSSRSLTFSPLELREGESSGEQPSAQHAERADAIPESSSGSSAPSEQRGLDGGFIVERLPFAGDLRRSEPTRERFPLAAIARLTKAPRHEAAPISAASALATLLSAAPFVNADPWRGERLEQILLRLASEDLAAAEDPGGAAAGHSMFELRFHPHDDGFWEVIRNALAEIVESSHVSEAG